MALTDNILAYYKLDNNGSGAVSLVDSTGNSNTLTNFSDVALGTGKINGAAHAQAGWLRTGTLVAESTATISCWFKSSIGEDFFPVVVDMQGCFQITAKSDGTLGVFNGQASGWDEVVSGGSYSDENWHHVVATRDGSSVKLYVDGALIGSSTYSGYSTPWDGIPYISMLSYPEGSYKSPSDTTLDEVGIWNRALTPNEVFNLYYRNEGNSYPFSKPVIEPQLTDNILAYWKLDNNGSGGVSLVDSTGNGKTLTNVNGTTLGVGKILGCGELSFSDTSHFSITPATGLSLGSGNFAVAGWFNSANLDPHGGGGYPTLISIGDWDAGSGNGMAFRPTPLGDGFQLLMPGSAYDITHTISTGQWYHYCVTRNSGVINVYINGVSIYTTPDTSNQSDASELVIGNRIGNISEENWDGLIDEVGIWNRDISSTEVGQLYNSGVGNSYPFGIVYFNAAVNGSLTTLGNWWQDPSFTIPATALPDGTKNVFIFANVTSGTGSYVSATINSASIASGVSITANTITLNGTSSNSGTLIGATSLNNTASNSGTITGNATIYYPSANPIGGTVSGTETYIWPNGTGLWGGEVWIDGSVSFIIPQPSDVRLGVEYGPAAEPYVGTYGGGGANKAISISQLLKLPFPINI